MRSNKLSLEDAWLKKIEDFVIFGEYPITDPNQIGEFPEIGEECMIIGIDEHKGKYCPGPIFTILDQRGRELTLHYDFFDSDRSYGPGIDNENQPKKHYAPKRDVFKKLYYNQDGLISDDSVIRMTA